MKMIKMTLLIFLLFAGVCPLEAGAQGSVVYIVKPGDSLWKISVRYEVGLSEIIHSNPQISNPHWIYPGEKVTVPIIGAKAWENQVISLVNEQRAKAGLAPLRANWELSRVARFKSRDMRDRGYFSHTSPTYGSPFQMMQSFGLHFSAAGENIAAGQRTPADVMNGWMNSPGHRQNILSPNYTQMGVGYVSGGAYGAYWTQMFIHE